MKFKALFAAALAAVLAAALLAPTTAVAGAKSKPLTVGKDSAGDWGSNTDPEIHPIGDALGMDLVGAQIGMADKKTVNFVIRLNSLPPSGGLPEIPRYIWSFTVNGNYAELDGKFTNYSRGVCDPTAGKCPPPRDPGLQPFFVRGNCVTDPTANLTTCQELGIVKATFDAAKATITIPVPLKLIKAKPGSKIAPGASDFSSQAGGSIIAIPSAFLSRTDMPLDSMRPTKTFTVPK